MSNFGSYHGFVGSVSSTNTEARRGVGTLKKKKKEKGKAVPPHTAPPPLAKESSTELTTADG